MVTPKLSEKQGQEEGEDHQEAGFSLPPDIASVHSQSLPSFPSLKIEGIWLVCPALVNSLLLVKA